MREYRGIRKDNGEWVEGWYAEWLCGHADMSPCIYPKDGPWHEVIPATVGQWTGKKDKEGVKIWEDSLVRYYSGTKYSGKKEYRVAPVKYNQETCQFNIVDKGWVFDLSCEYIQADIEVIGDIHTTPQLLEVQA